MFKTEYKEIFEESWRILKNNVVIFMPNAFMLLISLILGILYIWFSGFYTFFSETITLTDKLASERLILFVTHEWVWLLVFFLIYVFILFCSDVFFSLTKYGMIQDVIASRKSLLKDGFSFGKTHFFHSLVIHLFSIILILLPLFIIGFILSKFFTSLTLLACFSIFALLYKFLAIFRIILPYPIMAFEKKGAYKSIKTDFHYVKTQMGHLFISWLIVAGVSFIWIVVSAPDDVIAAHRRDIYLVAAIMIAFLIFELVLSTWEHLYVIEAHLSKKIAKHLSKKRVKKGGK